MTQPKLSPTSLVDALRRQLTGSADLIVLTRDRVQDTLDEAVRRGRMTRDDANDLMRALLDRGRTEADSLLGDLDRARRAVGLGAEFPIADYDELTAAKVNARLGELTPSQLRTLRDYERRNANRASVLRAIEKALP